MGRQLQNLRSEGELLKKSVEDKINNDVKEPKMHSATSDWILNSVEPPFASLLMLFFKLIPS